MPQIIFDYFQSFFSLKYYRTILMCVPCMFRVHGSKEGKILLFKFSMDDNMRINLKYPLLNNSQMLVY
ncbi:hypothetical protein PEPS_45530 (plasmid) [Persicobacter psychrovividus]|uniref:Uncharacterized protein n=1 Tax=Persicobacter psychrovividus TaxID=387638 RepID=A0ABN6LGJ1_9BACT|nr:hypothetical protein PEPS_45530 [Persicobacter psychrovividus]